MNGGTRLSYYNYTIAVNILHIYFVVSVIFANLFYLFIICLLIYIYYTYISVYLFIFFFIFFLSRQNRILSRKQILTYIGRVGPKETDYSA